MVEIVASLSKNYNPREKMKQREEHKKNLKRKKMKTYKLED